MKTTICTIALSLPVLLLGAMDAMTAENKMSGDVMGQAQSLIDFSEADRSQWYVVNDGVMGGFSESDIRKTSRQTAVFSGDLSLENNGGFASVRATVGTRDLSAHSGLEIRVRGDGRTYQLRLRSNEGFDGIAYRSYFETREGEWLEISLPFSEFVPTFRGRTLSDQPALDRSRIQQVAFMLADKNPGTFSLEIDYVRSDGGSDTIAP